MENKRSRMQCFVDGVCSVYFLNENQKPVLKYRNLRFEERVVGFKRYFTAAQMQVEINRLLRVPFGPDISPHDFIVIAKNGVQYQYQIVQVQPIPDTLPPSIDITLNQVEQLLQFDGGFDG